MLVLLSLTFYLSPLILHNFINLQHSVAILLRLNCISNNNLLNIFVIVSDAILSQSWYSILCFGIPKLMFHHFHDFSLSLSLWFSLTVCVSLSLSKCISLSFHSFSHPSLFYSKCHDQDFFYSLQQQEIKTSMEEHSHFLLTIAKFGAKFYS